MKANGPIEGFFRLAQALVVVVLLLWPSTAPSDRAQYFYDGLGRLVGVVDGQGNVAVYVYDEVGNLLRIERPSAGVGQSIGIFLVTPTRGLVPAGGNPGATVQIQGFGFSPTPTDNVVNFNGTTAAVTSATATSLVTTVPTGATTGPITVTNANGTATSPQAFTVLVPPIITGVDPVSVPLGTTSRVNIEGFNLDNTSAVTFTQPGLTATILPGGTSASLSINLVVGATVPINQPFTFLVTTPNGTAQSGAVTITVVPGVPSFAVAKPLSIFKPSPAQVAPSGPSFSVAPGVSVEMP